MTLSGAMTRRRRVRYTTVFCLLAAALFFLLVLNVNTGNVHISVGRILGIIFTRQGDPTEVDIIWKIRLPRLLMAASLCRAFCSRRFLKIPSPGPSCWASPPGPRWWWP